MIKNNWQREFVLFTTAAICQQNEDLKKKNRKINVHDDIHGAILFSYELKWKQDGKKGTWWFKGKNSGVTFYETNNIFWQYENHQ